MKQYIKNNYKFITALLIIILIFSIRFPYYIEAPGGIENIESRIKIDGYKSNGSLNLTYIKEYRATIPTLLVAYLNKDWDILKKEEIMLETEDYGIYELRDKILMEESISNAIYVAYTKANKKINIISNDLIVTYISDKALTDLKVGDKILSVNGEKVSSKDEITHIIEKFNINDKITIQVSNNNKKYNRYAKVLKIDDSKKIGVLISNVNKYETNPDVKVSMDSNESGPSGGLVAALFIYNSLIKEDITGGLTIVGTGTIDIDGSVGSIGGIEYKLKSAEISKADLFIVPSGENYEEAIKLKKEKNYKIEIVSVSTFDEIVKYLKNVN